VTARVVTDWALLVAVLALGALAMGGGQGALGVVAGGVLGLLNFRWLAADVRAACDAGAGGGRRPTWLPWAALRLAALAAAAGMLLVSGWLHPAGLVAGLTALPCALVTGVLRGAREEARG
jgi:hypothetical protein